MTNSTPILSKKTHRITIRINSTEHSFLKSMVNPSDHLRSLLNADMKVAVQNAK